MGASVYACLNVLLFLMNGKPRFLATLYDAQRNVSLLPFQHGVALIQKVIAFKLSAKLWHFLSMLLTLCFHHCLFSTFYHRYRKFFLESIAFVCSMVFLSHSGILVFTMARLRPLSFSTVYIAPFSHYLTMYVLYPWMMENSVKDMTWQWWFLAKLQTFWFQFSSFLIENSCLKL